MNLENPSPRRRWSPLLLRIGLPLLIVLGLLAVRSHQDRHTRYETRDEAFVARAWHWERLRKGMTRDEVATLLGSNRAANPTRSSPPVRSSPPPVKERWVYGLPEEDEPIPAETYYWIVYFGPAAPGNSPQAWRVVDFEMVRAPDPPIVY